MALISCEECNAEMSDVAIACPKCGHPNSIVAKKNKKEASQIYGLVAAALTLVMAVAPLSYQMLMIISPATVIAGLISVSKRQILAGLFAICLGSFGVYSAYDAGNDLEQKFKDMNSALHDLGKPNQ